MDVGDLNINKGSHKVAIVMVRPTVTEEQLSPPVHEHKLYDYRPNDEFGRLESWYSPPISSKTQMSHNWKT